MHRMTASERPIPQSRRFPFGIPNGWFLVAYAEDVAPGQVVRRHYLDRELVLFRGESGALAVLDAHCPHLGAHLGHGGRVVGDSLRCPFHAWRFDVQGRCVEIPYAERIPPRARAGVYPCVERNGMVFCWYDARGRAPAFEVPDIAEWHDPGYLTPWFRYEWTLRTQPQEMAENGIDWPHFASIHRMTVPDTRHAEFREHSYLWSVGGSKSVSTLEGARDDLVMRGENWGLGYSFLRQTGRFETVVATGLTPIDEATTHVQMGVIGKQAGLSRDALSETLRRYVEEHAVLAEEDFPIWENKRFRADPLLCDGDGPIAEYRRWAAQFYR